MKEVERGLLRKLPALPTIVVRGISVSEPTLGVNSCGGEELDVFPFRAVHSGPSSEGAPQHPLATVLGFPDIGHSQR